jgi:hypothetical protein
MLSQYRVCANNTIVLNTLSKFPPIIEMLTISSDPLLTIINQIL